MQNDGTKSVEDNDEFVRAIEALKDAETLRKPGLAVVRLRVPERQGTITITRSRFAADYGSICRMTFEAQPGAETLILTTFAPTVSCVQALRSADPAGAVNELFKQWIAKGR